MSHTFSETGKYESYFSENETYESYYSEIKNMSHYFELDPRKTAVKAKRPRKQKP